MCYNGAWGMPGEDHAKRHAAVDTQGKPPTEKNFSTAAEAFGMSTEESKTNILDLLKGKEQGVPIRDGYPGY